MSDFHDFDTIVIGGGHAGCEAAFAAARMGCRTALVSLDPSRIGVMSCNPAMGGLAKGQLIKEIDALGGVMGRITDLTAIQYRRLNSSKGPAVRSSRAQCDKDLYAQRMQEFLAMVPGLTILPNEVAEILVETRSGQEHISGIVTKDGVKILAKTVVLTSGTFLRGVMYTGFSQSTGGRLGDQAASTLSSSLERLGFRLHRLKTGTPPRLLKASLDFSKTEAQPGDEKPIPFSFYSKPTPFPYLQQVDCHITYTNPKTHEVIERNFDRSPMFTGLIQGVGPRYCPSIEDKVKRFRERERHQIFLEPEGLSSDEIYVNGISTSLPREVQEEFVRTIVGLENAQFSKYGYAVEYDCIDARQLRSTFESKDVQGLFFAGQVNGTSGYEEAGAQGQIAGINAALKIQEKDPFILTRSDAYMGVLADDLVLKGTDEPYRMFTSRAEHRLLLREDNADLRLSEAARRLGMLDDVQYALFTKRRDSIKEWQAKLSEFSVMPTPENNEKLAKMGVPALKDRVKGDVFLRRPEVKWAELCEFGFGAHGGEEVEATVQEQIEIQVKYEGYIKRDLDILAGVEKSEQVVIPVGLCFDDVPGLSNEIKGKLSLTRPETLGQASRISGVTPAAVANLMIFLKMKHSSKEGRGSGIDIRPSGSRASTNS